MEKLIGNTPMIKINYKYKNKIKSIYTKLEYYNPTGSIKDRMAYYIIKKAKENGDLKDNQPIIEATSGNTGISLSALGALYKHPVHIFMPDWVSIERQSIMKLYGANIHLVSKEEGGFQTAIKRADELAKKINGYRPNQFANQDNISAHYETTGKEILNQIDDIGAFVSGIGTGGTLFGVGKCLKEHDSSILLIALEPDSLPLLSQNINTGSHKIEGIGDDFVPELVDKSLIDKIVLINDLDAINMTKKIAEYLGLGVGISSGANLLASILINEKIDKKVVTVFPDDNKKYLTTDLAKEESINKEYISNQIELMSIENIEINSNFKNLYRRKVRRNQT